MKRLCSVSAFLACLVLATASLPAGAGAQTPGRLIPFQGELSNGTGAKLTGTFALLFQVYDAPAGGTALWSELHPEVSINAGRVNVILGNIRPITNLNFAGQTLHLGITVAPSASAIGTSQELIPRNQLLPSFHAFTASEATTVKDRAITAIKIAQNAITANEIRDGAIGSSKIQDGAIGSSKIQDGTIAPADLSGPTAQALVPTGALILWDQSNTCPAGYGEAFEFRSLTIRGADRGGGVAPSEPNIPDDAGRSCSAFGGTGCSAGARYDDVLQVDELASHSHISTALGPLNNFGPPGAVFGQSAAPVVPNPVGGNVPHYHPFRTVLFCRKL
jgi:hypothetical protein